jgi:hypothetical protein
LSQKIYPLENLYKKAVSDFVAKDIGIDVKYMQNYYGFIAKGGFIGMGVIFVGLFVMSSFSYWFSPKSGVCKSG